MILAGHGQQIISVRSELCSIPRQPLVHEEIDLHVNDDDSGLHGLSAHSGESKAVLVTGASSGIGRKITERLAAQGYFVYATARKDEDLKALGAIRNVQALRLDVTRPADIEAAVERSRKLDAASMDW